MPGRPLAAVLLFAAAAMLPASCGQDGRNAAGPPGIPAAPARPAPTAVAPAVRSIHVFVALCDNRSQGIVPVPAKLGNGEDPDNNLYWGAAYGLRTFFKKSPDWELLASERKTGGAVLERLVFRHRRAGAYLVADAYRGAEIRQAIAHFLAACAGGRTESLTVGAGAARTEVPAGGGARLLAYVGHNGLMDFALAEPPKGTAGSARQALVLACKSQPLFEKPIREAGARPLLLTTGFMAPEAYTLAAALEGWLAGEAPEAVAARAARAYDAYQKCGPAAARKLFAAGEGAGR
jgi:hypothetical protein